MRSLIEDVANQIRRPHVEAMAGAQARLDSLTKPPGSLGQLERLAVQLAGATGEIAPEILPATVLVMAGDHGVTAEGVSAFPSEVTPQMVQNFLAGGACINVLARSAGARVRVVDVGVAVPIAHPDLDVRKVRPGTANMATGPAMTRAEAEQAIAVGIQVAQDEIAHGARTLLLGEMGIGNTTPSAALVAVLGGRPVAQVVGRGTGLDDKGVQRKAAVIERAIAVNRPHPADPIDVLAKVGGLEIGALAGVMLGAAAAGHPVVLDGFITSAAALLAARIEPRVLPYLVASHQGSETGHAITLELLGLTPLLRLDLRLGEASGAALALPLIDNATRVLREMATFASAGVSGAVDGADEPASAAPLPPNLPPMGGGQAALAPEGAAALHEPYAFNDSPAPAPMQAPAGQDFTPAERAAVYKAIMLRRDIRRFRPDPIPGDLLERLLRAGHQGPSVGFMQPWNFIVIRNPATKQALKEASDRERRAAAQHFRSERQDLYLRLKLEGLTDAPVVLAVTCDPTRGGPHVLGRNSDRQTDVYSVSCAIQNIWLAARAEGVGLGWVSIYQKADVAEVLGMPPHVDPVGLLCLGYTDEFPTEPVLQQVGWRNRAPLDDVIFHEAWGVQARG